MSKIRYLDPEEFEGLESRSSSELEEACTWREEAEELQRKLTKKQRILVLVMALEGLTREEAAGLFGRSERAVYKMLELVRERLRPVSPSRPRKRRRS